jgi:hypothetical protein
MELTVSTYLIHMCLVYSFFLVQIQEKHAVRQEQNSEPLLPQERKVNGSLVALSLVRCLQEVQGPWKKCPGRAGTRAVPRRPLPGTRGAAGVERGPRDTAGARRCAAGGERAWAKLRATPPRSRGHLGGRTVGGGVTGNDHLRVTGHEWKLKDKLKKKTWKILKEHRISVTDFPLCCTVQHCKLNYLYFVFALTFFFNCL